MKKAKYSAYSILGFIFFTSLMIISGCGNGHNLNSSTDAEVINGISVPPEPNPKKNNATLAGVDFNNNGVRDDVEREFAKKAPSKFSDLMILGEKYQKILTQQLENSVENFEELNCMESRTLNLTFGGVEFENIVLNSKIRKNVYIEWLTTIDQSRARVLTIDDMCKE